MGLSGRLILAPRLGIRAVRKEVCWLDFMGADPHDLTDWLNDEGFRLVEESNDLQVWRSDDFPNIVLEVLNVDGIPKEPVSKIPGISAKQIHSDRRNWCVPRGMDPFFRCMIYSDVAINPELDPNEIGIKNVSKLLASLFQKKIECCEWET